jgi:hypothetical protein
MDQNRQALAAPDAEAEAQYRVMRFLARIDAHLPAMAPAEQRKFIDRLIEAWEARYARFIQTQGASEHFANRFDPVTAADFTLTLCGLAARRPMANSRGD